jgi:hypothetical protein
MAMVRPDTVALAVIRVRRPPEDAPPSARMTSCRDVLDSSWTVLTASEKEFVLLNLAIWLDEVWGAPPQP